MSNNDRLYLTRAEAAQFLTDNGYPIGKGTLQKIASTGGGPPYRIFGNRSLYDADQLLEWAANRCFHRGPPPPHA